MQVYDELASDDATSALLTDLAAFADEVDVEAGFASFVAILRGPPLSSEKRFEDVLWAQLRLLRGADEQAWNPDVSADPTDGPGRVGRWPPRLSRAKAINGSDEANP